MHKGIAPGATYDNLNSNEAVGHRFCVGQQLLFVVSASMQT